MYTLSLTTGTTYTFSQLWNCSTE